MRSDGAVDGSEPSGSVDWLELLLTMAEVFTFLFMCFQLVYPDVVQSNSHITVCLHLLMHTERRVIFFLLFRIQNYA